VPSDQSFLTEFPQVLVIQVVSERDGPHSYQPFQSPDLSPPISRVAWRRGSNENGTRNASPFAARRSFVD
jgi:hypothetical protein